MRATVVPAVAVPISLLGTFGVMYLLGYSLDNLSLMALIIATGFVVDDAIVVLENITRHMEAGMPRFEAALLGAREVGFTVLSMSLSLVAVFIPILLMGGIVGRLFREFSVTLSVAVLISLLVSLTTTPMLCSRFIRVVKPSEQGRLYHASERAFEAVLSGYERSLRWALRNGALLMVLLLAIVVFNIYLYWDIPKGFFPQQDTGRLTGGIQADQSISFQAMEKKLARVHQAGAVRSGRRHRGRVHRRRLAGRRPDQQRLRLHVAQAQERTQAVGGSGHRAPAAEAHPGGRRAPVPAGGAGHPRRRPPEQRPVPVHAAGRTTSQELYAWAPKLAEALAHVPVLTEVNSDQQQNGLEIDLGVDRDTASRLQLNPASIDNTLYDAFGQRDVSTIYNPLNQYHVVMEVAPQYWQSPETLNNLWISTAGGTVSGTQATNAVAGTVTSAADRAPPTPRRPSPPTRPSTRRPTPRQHRTRQRLHRLRRQHRRRARWCRSPPSAQHGPGQHAARGQSPGHLRRHHHLLQPGAERLPQPGHRGDRAGLGADRHAGRVSTAASRARRRPSSPP